MSFFKCAVDGCEAKRLRKGYCDHHYNLLLRKTDRPGEGESRRAYWHKHKVRLKALSKVWWANNDEKRKAYADKWRKEHPEERKGRNAKWRLENADRHRENARKWDRANRSRIYVLHGIKRALTRNATPAWANSFFMQEAYDLAKRRTLATGFKWHVDHIVPLKSKIVCGLHTHTNLQVIPAVSNIRKNNRFWPDMP